jgi:hypothetical protein
MNLEMHYFTNKHKNDYVYNFLISIDVPPSYFNVSDLNKYFTFIINH